MKVGRGCLVLIAPADKPPRTWGRESDAGSRGWKCVEMHGLIIHPPPQVNACQYPIQKVDAVLFSWLGANGKERSRARTAPAKSRCPSFYRVGVDSLGVRAMSRGKYKGARSKKCKHRVGRAIPAIFFGRIGVTLVEGYWHLEPGHDGPDQTSRSDGQGGHFYKDGCQKSGQELIPAIAGREPSEVQHCTIEHCDLNLWPMFRPHAMTTIVPKILESEGCCFES